MDAYSLHIAMAALAGASVAAVSAYFAHRKTLADLLEFAFAAEIERGRGKSIFPRHRSGRGRHRRRRGRGESGSPSDVAAAAAGGSVASGRGSLPVRVELSRLHSLPEDWRDLPATLLAANISGK